MNIENCRNRGISQQVAIVSVEREDAFIDYGELSCNAPDRYSCWYYYYKDIQMMELIYYAQDENYFYEMTHQNINDIIEEYYSDNRKIDKFWGKDENGIQTIERHQFFASFSAAELDGDEPSTHQKLCELMNWTY